ncbi:Subtilase family protein [Chitinophaga terrae (ex Kim and Jung 2007)]|uniref:Subtilase family protein n=1 Tax=Chitinophaga terrae (ex Kim and Jung 2007) TaxID=408074 RepID=A0A1H4CDR0_9BACT|nr:S8 family peptidase [Chitinophaga terrae (ex Kim and Jung 2007)]SEA58460.1 Subtilase family protein [Chitinophaga terrae (ex Kim and Jung 2007)]
MKLFSREVAAFAGCLALMTTFTLNTNAQSKSPLPKNWHLLTYETDSVYGTSTEKAYKELLKGKKSTPVIVAVIDSGIDTLHEDLKPVLWTNPREIPGNGKDDDRNGYIDDIHGWNFLGGKDGSSVQEDSEEATREYFRIKEKYVNPDSALTKDDKDYAIWQKVKNKVGGSSNTQEKMEYRSMSKVQENVNKCESILKNFLGKDNFTLGELDSIQTTNQDVLLARNFMTRLLKSAQDPDITFKDFKSEFDEYMKDLKRKAEAGETPPNANRERIVGDNLEDIKDNKYGNNDVMGKFGFHGTHVSGIIAAVRNNGLGIEGVADNVKIMFVKAVPDGDERDKDVALAIRYAVDNGAQIINMSFGKPYSPHKDWVDDAVKYAESKGVLLVHAAGNDGNNNDSIPNFPNPNYLSGGKATNFITVGASSTGRGNDKVANFSNYGKNEVDLFAPGVQIYSTVPGGNSYRMASGTSMASPVVAGVAALVLSYYPELSAQQLKYVLEKSATPLPDSVKMVTKPGTRDEEIDFAELSRTGGIVNAYEALKLAATLKGENVKKKQHRAKMRPVRKN